MGECILHFGISDGADSPYFPDLFVIATHTLGKEKMDGFDITLKTKEFGSEFYYINSKLKVYTNQKNYTEYDIIGPLLDTNQCYEIWINKHLSINDTKFILY